MITPGYRLTIAYNPLLSVQSTTIYLLKTLVKWHPDHCIYIFCHRTSSQINHAQNNGSRLIILKYEKYIPDLSRSKSMTMTMIQRCEKHIPDLSPSISMTMTMIQRYEKHIPDLPPSISIYGIHVVRYMTA